MKNALFLISYSRMTLWSFEANLDQLCYLRCLFLCFEAVSVLKVKLAKSKLVLVGAMEDVEGLARILGCRVSSLLMKYVGLLLGASFKD
jgi:hypothetical protein